MPERDAPPEPPVVLSREGACALVRLNRPDRLNAVNLELYEKLTVGLEAMAQESEVRVLILTGTGRAFCAGADMKAHGEGEMPPDRRRVYIEAGQQANRLLQTIPKPVVAAVNGHAIGAGIELALSCDFIVVAEEAKLRLPEAALGTFVGGGTVYTLPRRVGLARARELVMLASFFDGREARELGLADRAVPAERVLSEAKSLAEALARNAPVSLAAAKRLFDRAGHLEPDSILGLEAEALAECMATDDWREGVRAFAEKREPRFRGE